MSAGLARDRRGGGSWLALNGEIQIDDFEPESSVSNRATDYPDALPFAERSPGSLDHRRSAESPLDLS